MNAKQHPDANTGPASAPATGARAIPAHDAYARPQDEKRLLEALLQILRRKREAMDEGGPMMSQAGLEPIWPPLLDALANHAQRRRDAEAEEPDAELRALADALRLELDGLGHAMDAWGEGLRNALAPQRRPLQGAYGAATAASGSPHSLGRG